MFYRRMYRQNIVLQILRKVRPDLSCKSVPIFSDQFLLSAVVQGPDIPKHHHVHLVRHQKYFLTSSLSGWQMNRFAFLVRQPESESTWMFLHAKILLDHGNHEQ